MKLSRHAKMYAQIQKHGENLLKLFPDATERDPLKLCKKLRNLETTATRHTERLCSVPDYEETAERELAIVERKVSELLGSDRPWINRDPRGHALMVDLLEGERLYSDWGGYGILAPEFDGR